MVFHHIHSVPEPELHCGLSLTCLTLLARNVKKFQSKSTNSNKVNKLQPKKRPMFPPMSAETEQKKAIENESVSNSDPFPSLPPVRTNIIYRLCWNTMHNSLANQRLNVSPIRKKKTVKPISRHQVGRSLLFMNSMVYCLLRLFYLIGK